ncbi:hypothetical protein IscW_ISCW020058 [Ixodes scapularis]|uniref:Uncharacterized protein n=1 Tax=Ixodes scapularis TaxID=6945 RepID=B7Q202_IXOSC|nr:hypothetical protein IscW_ISCW020058 [Ixodes scapularis]|eukprot:XP_002410298.1 hypothetical protein IscW_ISCW020058 [Ixodes scapularis]
MFVGEALPQSVIGTSQASFAPQAKKDTARANARGDAARRFRRERCPYRVVLDCHFRTCPEARVSAAAASGSDKRRAAVPREAPAAAGLRSVTRCGAGEGSVFISPGGPEGSVAHRKADSPVAACSPSRAVAVSRWPWPGPWLTVSPDRA